MTEFKVGDIVKVPWGNSIGMIIGRDSQFWIVKFILRQDNNPNQKDGGYLPINLVHIT